jgi:hypothetical protein
VGRNSPRLSKFYSLIATVEFAESFVIFQVLVATARCSQWCNPSIDIRGRSLGDAAQRRGVVFSFRICLLYERLFFFHSVHS